MSLTQLFQTIDNSFIGRFVDKKLNVLNHTNPNRIYVENVRSFYNLPFSVARFICEVAVREGIFTKHYALECPNEGRVIITTNNRSWLPETVVCQNCELLERDKYEFRLSECKVTEFYKLNV
jgi:hypothetical protein